MNKILAIESSCDETAAAVLVASNRNINVKSSVVSSQIKIHQATQGVVPEVAARAHIRKIDAVVQKALTEAGEKISSINTIAVTTGPGLISSLLVGVEYAKGLAMGSGKQIFPVNHMHGHLFSAFLEDSSLKLPSINLIVSGGHTYLVLMLKKDKFKIIGQTVDDAAGEAFDKVAKMLSLPYPGGPQISKHAAKGKNDYNFPRPMINSNNFDFSFAGLKTSVLYKIRDEKLDISKASTKADIAMSFENAAIEVLVKKTLKAAQKYKAKSITLSGGVAANKKLRQELEEMAKQYELHFYVPAWEYCTDNAVMIGNAAAIQMLSGMKPIAYNKLKVDPGLEI